MKSYLKAILGIFGLASISRVLLAADATTAYTTTTYATNTHSPLYYSASNPIALSSSNAFRLALNAQALLLKELMQEHQKRAADLTQKGQSEKAKWESELVNELQEKSARLQKSIDQATKTAAGEVDDSLVFASTVEARLEQLRQELSAAFEEARVLATQIGTNTSPDILAGMSVVLGENQRLIKELQREQLDLEIRKLEFRAIWKLLQK